MDTRLLKYICFALIALIFGGIVYQFLLDAEDLRREPAVVLPSEAEIQSKLNELPIVFQENRGQTDERVKYLAKSGKVTIFITEDEIVYAFTNGVLRQRHVNSTPVNEILANDKVEYTSNYFIGNDPDQWQSSVPSFKQLNLFSLYDGIDLQLGGDRLGLQYLYSVEPGVDLSKIQMSFDGANDVGLNPDGTLVVVTDFGNFGLRAPKASQAIQDDKRILRAKYQLLDNLTVGFIVDDVDETKSLEIRL